MMKSPGGSLFPYYYKGGEIHCLKYGNKYKNEVALFDLMRREEDFIKQKNKKIKIWVDLYNTSITERVLEELVQHLVRMDDYINKLSIVGLSGLNRWRLKRSMKKAGIKLHISYYSDPEDAKTWLVSE